MLCSESSGANAIRLLSNEVTAETRQGAATLWNSVIVVSVTEEVGVLVLCRWAAAKEKGNQTFPYNILQRNKGMC